MKGKEWIYEGADAVEDVAIGKKDFSLLLKRWKIYDEKEISQFNNVLMHILHSSVMVRFMLDLTYCDLI